MGGGGGGRVKIKLFQNMVMLHILKRIKNAAACNMVANFLPTDTPLSPRHLFQNMVMLDMKLKCL